MSRHNLSYWLTDEIDLHSQIHVGAGTSDDGNRQPNPLTTPFWGKHSIAFERTIRQQPPVSIPSSVQGPFYTSSRARTTTTISVNAFPFHLTTCRQYYLRSLVANRAFFGDRYEPTLEAHAFVRRTALSTKSFP